jgi:glycosyl transferase family 87
MSVATPKVLRARSRVARGLAARSRWTPSVIALAGLIVALCALQAVWYLRFRAGYITDLDESWFIARALNIHALGAGPREFLRSTIVTGVQGPVVPATTVPFLLLFGDSIGAAWAMAGTYLALLVMATYAVARRLVPAPWAVLSALVVGTAPVVSDYSRLYHLGVPAAAVLTIALWCVLRSDRLLERRFAIIAGGLLGVLILTRIMTLAFLPTQDARRRRLMNIALLWLTAAAVAAPWWVVNFDAASSYLTGYGYGSEAADFGTGYSVLSLDYWLKELRVIADYLFVPLLLVVLACIAGGALTALAGRAEWRRADVRRWVRSDAFLLAAIVAGGYLALTSSPNEGTAFSLPWLPSLVILVVAAAAAVPRRGVRVALALGLSGAALFNAAVKNGVSTGLSEPASAKLPILGETVTKDGRDRVYQMLDALGYPVPSPPRRLSAMHREWLPLNRRLVAFINRYARARAAEPRVIDAAADWMLYDTRLYLASELWAARALAVSPAIAASTPDAYRKQFEDAGTNFVMTADPPRRANVSGVNSLAVVGAMLDLRFRTVMTTRAPDGRRVMLWWRDVPDAKVPELG